jgi:hypothetical protein
MSLNSACHHSSHSNAGKCSSNAVNLGHTNSNTGSKQVKDNASSRQQPATNLTPPCRGKAGCSASCPNVDAILGTSLANTSLATIQTLDPCKAQATWVLGSKLPPILIYLM